jgi:RNA polymerase sigma-70 factor (ECF subfamily)
VIDWPVIIRKHGPAVWQTAYRLLGNEADAADCFQETFICAFEASRRERVRSFSALLAHLATLRAIDRLRRRFRERHGNTEMANEAAIASTNPGPAQQVQTQELVGKLREALGRLQPQESQVFSLRYLNDMSYQEIARQLGIKTNTAGVLLHRARAKLRGLLETIVLRDEK